ncbi:MAG: glycosyltransferase [Microthrixaceae bacterium]
MRFTRRFALTGLVVTLVDLGLVILLVRTTRWAFPLVDAVAVALAATASYVLHRLISYAAEPAGRWYRNPVQFVAAAAFALGVDVAVFSLITIGATRDSGRVFVGKAVALLVAFLVRMLLYRRSMFRAVSADQRRPRHRDVPAGDVRLSLVVPAFREVDAIATTVRRVDDALGGLRDDGGFELIVVDDGSADGTADAARDAGADRVIELDRNRGKGGAVRAGVAVARGRTVAFTDADLSYSPDQVLHLLERVEQGWDMVVGSRKHTDTRTLTPTRRIRELGSRLVNAMTSIVLLGRYLDTQCGLKAFRADSAAAMFGHGVVDGFAFDVELFHLAERYRLSVVEVPVHLDNSSRSTVHVLRDTARLVRDLLRIRATAHTGGYELSEQEASALGVAASHNLVETR